LLPRAFNAEFNTCEKQFIGISERNRIKTADGAELRGHKRDVVETINQLYIVCFWPFFLFFAGGKPVQYCLFGCVICAVQVQGL